MERLAIMIKSPLYMIIAGILFLTGACKDAYEDNTYMAYEEKPIALLLKSDPDGKYALWVEILEKADLYNTLNLARIYTFFAPTNTGVERYLQKLGLSSVSQMTKEDANYLVKYHLIPGAQIDLGQFQSGAINDLNATDDNLYIEFRELGLEAVYLNSESRINTFDIKATNGIIHSLDDVLVPLTATIYNRLEDPKFSVFREAVVATGLDEILNRVYTEAVDQNGEPIQQRFKYTTFAVSNSTLAKEGIQSLQDLVQKLEVPSGSDYKNPENGLYKYVAYHILAQQRSYGDLGKFPEGVHTMNFETMAANELMKVSEGPSELVINATTDMQSYIQFVEFNIVAKNGVVHEVDNWMPLFLPERVQVIWEFTDYPDVAANVTNYRKSDLGAQYNKTFTASELTSIKWQSVPENRADVLIYRNNRSNDGIWYTGTLNWDHFRVTLGESGWIEFKTPTIVRGKYRVTFVWVSPASSTNSGICSFIMDNQTLNPRFVISNTAEGKRTQVLGEVDFQETTSHTLRILSLDGRLIILDHIVFDPID
ncbi:DUF5108 domain-containing protein [Sphingobacterium olei]|uniref:DUF5108 domain-containing protein n=1 Tax=Sphingobacterium olei TaxID=2571155 RepID=A0A4U0P1P7_9SPHI|nr:fasciclin domain-containing protein [Sphingobacterium olei]TJZ61129.1 DUF5108 domain-containing protein [Sphingobacterium olei]